MELGGNSVVSLACLLVVLCAGATVPAWGDGIPHAGFADVNGVRLQYLDWEGQGRPALVLIHGLADNPYIFDDLAPAFSDRFHVIAYARRGSGGSGSLGPYDLGTLSEDLRGLMDALRIQKAVLVGLSAGGNDASEMATRYPERVDKIIYLDGAYDWADPEFKVAVQALPLRFFDPPASAMASLDAFRSYVKTTTFPDLDDIGRIEENLRGRVVLQSDGSVKYRTPSTIVDALYSALWSGERRDYARIHCPVLAIYAEHLYDRNVADAKRRAALLAYEQRYWQPFQAHSQAHLRRELPNVQVERIAGSHSSFLLTSRQKVVETMRAFLDAPVRAPVPVPH